MPIETDNGGTKSTALPIIIKARTRQFSGTPRTMLPESVKFIAIHHAAGVTATPDGIWDNHMSWPPDKGGPLIGAGYNFYIRKSGEIHEMRGFTYEGVHTPGYNNKSMGICCEGNYSQEKSMPAAQMQSLIGLCYVMFERFHKLNFDVSRIIKHSAAVPTECPGTFFPWSDFITKLSRQMKYGNTFYAVTQGVSPNGLAGNPGLDVYTVIPSDKSWYEVAVKLGTNEAYLRSINPQIISSKPIAGQKVFYKKTVINNGTNVAANDDDFADAALEIAGSIVAQSILDQDYGKGGGASNYKLLGMTNREEAILSMDESRPSLSAIKGLKESKFGNTEAKRKSIDVTGVQTEYEKFKIYVETSSGVSTYMFKIDPTQMSETRSRQLSQLKTNGGYIIVDGGAASPMINLSGIMIDIDGDSERLDFLAYYKSFVEKGNYKRIYMYLEGVLYSIEILNVTTNSSGAQGAIKSYGMSIMVLNDTIGGTESIGLVTSTETQFKATISTNIIPDLIDQSGVTGVKRGGS